MAFPEEGVSPQAAEGAQGVDSAPSGWTGFHDLVRHRVNRVLLVASSYESFILAEDGQPHALMLSEFLDLNVRHIPGFRAVTSGAEALDYARRGSGQDLVIASIHLGDMSAAELASRLRASGVDTPVMLLAYDAPSLEEFTRLNDTRHIERAFLWQGDARIFLAIVKYVEDRMNLAWDSGRRGVQIILVVEDSVRYYSSFLPVIYAEVIEQARRLVPEGLNLGHKLLRVQARPKVVLCSSFEEAERLFTAYQESVLGLISDVEFPRQGRLSPDAGVELARTVRRLQPDVPIILHSRAPGHEAAAAAIGACFLRKGSPLLLEELRRLMTEFFGFGDFVFRLPDGQQVARAGDLRGIEVALRTVPAESIAFHAERNHFSRWLKARTEFALAQHLRPRRVSDFPNVEALRTVLIESIHEYRQRRSRATISDFQPETFDPAVSFARVGSGSLGGKARGLAFVNLMLSEQGLDGRFEGVRIGVPSALVLGTDLFDEFLRRNALRDHLIANTDDSEVRARMLAGEFPDSLRKSLAAFLAAVREPLAVRSSSLLEDSRYRPSAGVYATYMLPNDDPSPEVRLMALLRAIKLVYASTFSARSRSYLDAANYRLEEQKMAVLVQKLVGVAHGDRFYPDLAGVARSHNVYPVPPMRAEDGIASVALGFGARVVEGKPSLGFCPCYPRNLIQQSSVDEQVRTSQRSFYALELSGRPPGSLDPEFALSDLPLAEAEADGTLHAVGSTYSPENDCVYDGIGRPGTRLVSFAAVLKHEVFPLADILCELLELGSQGMGGPVEIEFAANLTVRAGKPREFAFLQLRPLGLTRPVEDVELVEVEAGRVLCRSEQVLGHGRVDGIRDLVVVDRERFDRARSRDVAAEIHRFNSQLLRGRTPYLLVGVGRIGSADPFLGIPVTWDQIAGAQVIVETGFRDLRVTPSQGTHFFQNLSASNVGYFTVNPEIGDGVLDWEWLNRQPAAEETGFVRHVRLDRPVVVAMSGGSHRGLILKPEA